MQRGLLDTWENFSAFCALPEARNSRPGSICNGSHVNEAMFLILRRPCLENELSHHLFWTIVKMFSRQKLKNFVFQASLRWLKMFIDYIKNILPSVRNLQAASFYSASNITKLFPERKFNLWYFLRLYKTNEKLLLEGDKSSAVIHSAVSRLICLILCCQNKLEIQ